MKRQLRLEVTWSTAHGWAPATPLTFEGAHHDEASWARLVAELRRACALPPTAAIIIREARDDYSGQRCPVGA